MDTPPAAPDMTPAPTAALCLDGLPGDRGLQAMRDYPRTQYGGWPWPTHAHTHGKSERFAQHPDGRVEKPKA